MIPYLDVYLFLQCLSTVIWALNIKGDQRASRNIVRLRPFLILSLVLTCLLPLLASLGLFRITIEPFLRWFIYLLLISPLVLTAWILILLFKVSIPRFSFSHEKRNLIILLAIVFVPFGLLFLKQNTSIQ
ncbi:hypothetical protein SAMN05216474_0435 [Lishizhenia tianjinensis]|uniref:Uncharacterized protein n=1 Tax=Lishizhenia tianjinensis TaxID=477690 RepID=A0A1I6XUQ6_9FLAO|nr:hypothetical protein SAMN05216474_0435 [Lishizhenia tianjinensis]